jgi:carnitine-CoA ligase
VAEAAFPTPFVEPTFAATETLPMVLARWAEREPDRPYLHDVGGGSRTYGEFHEASLRWADAFRRLGIARGESVAAMVRTRITSCEHWMGLGWLGAVQTGVNTDLRDNSLAYVLNNCRARYMICEHDLLERVTELVGRLDHLQAVIVPDVSADEVPRDLPFRVVAANELWSDARPASGLRLPERHEIGCITYTSGTTGAPKGILVPWGRMWPEVVWLDVTGDDICYDPFPVFHLSGLLPMAWLGFPGGQVVLRDGFKTQCFWDDVRAFRCTMTCLIPAMMNWLIDEPPRADDVDNPLRVVAGAPVVSRIEHFKERFGILMRTCYSSGESGMPLYAGPDVSFDRASNAMWSAPGFDVRAVDEHDNEVPYGEGGELVVRSDQPWRMMAGYLGMPEKTAAAWRNGWFHTGDRVVRDERGRFSFVDRLTDSMRRRGENISAMEVEAYATEHPAVSECAAIAVPSEHGEDEVKVCIVRTEGKDLTHAELHAFLKDRMPAFMVPRYIEFLDDPERTEAMKRIKKAPLRANPLNEKTWDAQRD